MAYLRLQRERHENNHSPLQVQVSAVSLRLHVRLPGDLSRSVSGIEPSYPVRSGALHLHHAIGNRAVRFGRGGVTLLLPLCVRPSAQIGSSPVLNPESPVESLHLVHLMAPKPTLLRIYPPPAHTHLLAPLLLCPGCISTGNHTCTQTHTLLVLYSSHRLL